MKTFITIVEKCPETGLYVGYLPGLPGADVQAETLDELYHDLHEVVDMLLQDGNPLLTSKLLTTQTVIVA